LTFDAGRIYAFGTSACRSLLAQKMFAEVMNGEKYLHGVWEKRFRGLICVGLLHSEIQKGAHMIV
jgi:hypothetical protein